MNMKIVAILIFTLFVAITMADSDRKFLERIKLSLNLFIFFISLYLEKCKDNEEWKECGTKCPDTCLNHNILDRSCVKMCVAGCFCRTGFIRLGYDANGGNGKCVPIDYCDLIPHKSFNE